MSIRLSFVFNVTATTEIYTLSLHDALPISTATRISRSPLPMPAPCVAANTRTDARPARLASQKPRDGCSPARRTARSEEYTSELQSRQYPVRRLLLEKKKSDARYRVLLRVR